MERINPFGILLNEFWLSLVDKIHFSVTVSLAPVVGSPSEQKRTGWRRGLGLILEFAGPCCSNWCLPCEVGTKCETQKWHRENEIAPLLSWILGYPFQCGHNPAPVFGPVNWVDLLVWGHWTVTGLPHLGRPLSAQQHSPPRKKSGKSPAYQAWLPHPNLPFRPSLPLLGKGVSIGV